MVVTNGYGMTETSPAGIALNAKWAMKKIGSVGRLFPNIEARIVAEDGRDAGVGEIWLR